MLTIQCNSCGEQFMVGDEVVGEQVMCPACAKPVRVEAPASEEETGPIAEGAWEYLVLRDHGRMGHIQEKQLNHAGRDGWELVSVFKENPESNTAFYFKRPLRRL